MAVAVVAISAILDSLAMARWPDTLLEPKAGSKCHGSENQGESWGERYYAAHKASTENTMESGWTSIVDVGGFQPLSRVHDNERTHRREHAVSPNVWEHARRIALDTTTKAFVQGPKHGLVSIHTKLMRLCQCAGPTG